MRVVADHLRTLVFAIADGVLPSNEGRGYVLRRLLRRAYRYGKKLNFHEPFLHQLVTVVCAEMNAIYPELVEHQVVIEKVILQEEKLFDVTLNRGLELFDGLIERLTEKKQTIILGADAFKLYDTYGFPFDFTMLLAKEKNFSVDEKGFLQEMVKQKERSSAESHATSSLEIDKIWMPVALKSLLSLLAKQIAEQKIISQYVGDEQSICQGKLLLIATDDGIITDEIAHSSSPGALVFEETVFYGEGGGQCGDVGVITDGVVDSTNKDNKNEFKVIDTKKIDGRSIHLGYVMKGSFVKGKSYALRYDTLKRNAIRKNHTATHLLHKALRSKLGSHVRQAGSFLNHEKLRFDFNHHAPLTADELNHIEQEVNIAIFAGHSVKISVMPKHQAEQLGAIAFFADKYGDEVRVVDIPLSDFYPHPHPHSKSYSLELCGGSHVRKTSEIGILKIIQETSSAAGVRRIEAVTAHAAYRYFTQVDATMKKLQKLLDAASLSDLSNKAEKMLLEKKALEKIHDKMLATQVADKFSSLPTQKVKRKSADKNPQDIIFLYATFSSDDDITIQMLRSQIDAFKQKHPDGVIFLTNLMLDEKKIIFLCGVGRQAVQLGIQAGKLAQIAATRFDGKGGGKSDFAQAGAKINHKDSHAIDQALADIQQHILMAIASS